MGSDMSLSYIAESSLTLATSVIPYFLSTTAASLPLRISCTIVPLTVGISRQLTSPFSTIWGSSDLSLTVGSVLLRSCALEGERGGGVGTTSILGRGTMNPLSSSGPSRDPMSPPLSSTSNTMGSWTMDSDVLGPITLIPDSMSPGPMDAACMIQLIHSSFSWSFSSGILPHITRWSFARVRAT